LVGNVFFIIILIVSVAQFFANISIA